MRRHTSMPSMSGRPRSRTTTSGGVEGDARRAPPGRWRPSSTVVARAPSAPRRQRAQMAGSSSTTRTRGHGARTVARPGRQDDDEGGAAARRCGPRRSCRRGPRRSPCRWPGRCRSTRLPSPVRNGSKMRRAPSGTPVPSSATRTSTMAVRTRAALTRTMRAGGRVAGRVLEEVGDAPGRAGCSRRPPAAGRAGRRSWTRTCREQAAAAGWTRSASSSSTSTAWRSGAKAPASMRLRLSRLATRRSRRSASSHHESSSSSVRVASS